MLIETDFKRSHRSHFGIKKENDVAVLPFQIWPERHQKPAPHYTASPAQAESALVLLLLLFWAALIVWLARLPNGHLGTVHFYDAALDD